MGGFHGKVLLIVSKEYSRFAPLTPASSEGQALPSPPIMGERVGVRGMIGKGNYSKNLCSRGLNLSRVGGW